MMHSFHADCMYERMGWATPPKANMITHVSCQIDLRLLSTCVCRQIIL